MKSIPAGVGRLLDDLGRGDLAGDLAEELQGGRRSRVWAWWQIAVAVLSGIGLVVRQNPYLTFRAVAVGWITFQVLNGQLPFSSHPEIRAWVSQSPAWLLLIVAQYVAAGWSVRLLHARHRAAMLGATALFFVATNTLQLGVRTYFMSRFNDDIHALNALPPLMLWLVLPVAVIVGGVMPIERSRWAVRRIARITNKAGLVSFGIGFMIGTGSIHAQPAAPQVFDVASIKPSAPPDPANPLTMFPLVIPQPDGSVRATTAPLVTLVRFAYNVDDDQIIGGPAWKLTARFDVTAKPGAGSDKSTDAARQRLKALLADRFALKTHQEMRDMTVSALVLADTTGTLGRDLKPTSAVCGPNASEICRTFMTGQRDATGRLQMLFRGVGQPISALANMVGQAIGRRVIDGTGLTGLYDFETDLPVDPQALLQSARQSGFVATAEVAQNLASDEGPAMTSVLQQRLGLKLETRRASVPVLVIDSAQMPSAD